jgi:hypothetical protein
MLAKTNKNRLETMKKTQNKPEQRENLDNYSYVLEEREKNEPSTPELSGHQTKWNINLWLLSAVSLYLEFWKP